MTMRMSAADTTTY